MALHNFWTLISDGGTKYQLQINDENKIFMLCKYGDGTENRLDLIGDSHEACIINGLNRIGEMKNDETLNFALKNLHKFLGQS
jgi:hypothetical protein